MRHQEGSTLCVVCKSTRVYICVGEFCLLAFNLTLTRAVIQETSVTNVNESKLCHKVLIYHWEI